MPLSLISFSILCFLIFPTAISVDLFNSFFIQRERQVLLFLLFSGFQFLFSHHWYVHLLRKIDKKREKMASFDTFSVNGEASTATLSFNDDGVQWVWLAMILFDLDWFERFPGKFLLWLFISWLDYGMQIKWATEDIRVKDLLLVFLMGRWSNTPFRWNC